MDNKIEKSINVKTIGNWNLELKITKEVHQTCCTFKLMLYCNLNNTVIEFKHHNFKVGDRVIPKKILKFANLNYSKFNTVRDCLSSYDLMTVNLQNSKDHVTLFRNQYVYNYFLGKVDLSLSPVLVEAQYHIYKIQRRN